MDHYSKDSPNRFETLAPVLTSLALVLTIASIEPAKTNAQELNTTPSVPSSTSFYRLTDGQYLESEEAKKHYSELREQLMQYPSGANLINRWETLINGHQFAGYRLQIASVRSHPRWSVEGNEVTLSLPRETTFVGCDNNIPLPQYIAMFHEITELITIYDGTRVDQFTTANKLCPPESARAGQYGWDFGSPNSAGSGQTDENLTTIELENELRRQSGIRERDSY